MKRQKHLFNILFPKETTSKQNEIKTKEHLTIKRDRIYNNRPLLMTNDITHRRAERNFRTAASRILNFRNA